MNPKKKKGFRKIIVGDKTYSWRFSDSIEIRPEQNPSNKLEIDFGSFDPWLYVNDPGNKPEDSEPKIATPGFIKKAIENAIQLGWNIETKNKLTKLKYSVPFYKVTDEDGDMPSLNNLEGENGDFQYGPEKFYNISVEELKFELGCNTTFESLTLFLAGTDLDYGIHANSERENFEVKFKPSGALLSFSKNNLIKASVFDSDLYEKIRNLD